MNEWLMKQSPTGLMEEEMPSWVLPVLQMLNHKLNIERKFAQGHKANKWRSRDSNPGLSDFSAHTLPRVTCVF